MIKKTKYQHFGLLVAIAALLVYANSLGNGFAWDDEVVIVANPALRGDALALFHSIDTTGSDQILPYYRPLTLLTFLIEERLHSLTPLLMHLLNVLLHAANAVLVYHLAKAVTKDSYAALFTGLLFAVHPLNSESVDFLSGGRNTMLACFFVLSSYLFHRRSVLQNNISGAAAGAVLLLAGLFSKEIAIAVLPFLAFMEINQSREAAPDHQRRVVLRLAPYALCTLLYMTLRIDTLSAAGARIEMLPGLGTRLLDNLYIIPRYLLSVICPPTLSVRYFVPEELHPLTFPLAAAWLFIIGVLGWILTRGRSRASLFGLLWLTAFWLPVSGIIAIPSAPLADRYLYVPAIGLWLIIADQAVRVFPPRNASRRYARTAAVLILLTLAAVTTARNPIWKDTVTLFTKLTAQYPDRAYSHYNLGAAFLNRQDDISLSLAEKEFEKAMAIDPTFPLLQTQMGYVLLMKKDFTGALQHYTEALRLDPQDDQARINRAITLEYLGRGQEALEDYIFFLAKSDSRQLPGSLQYAEERIRELSPTVSPFLPNTAARQNFQLK